MTCFENFINENYTLLLSVSKKYVGEKYAEDLLHDMLIKFLEKQDRLDALCNRGEMLPYICRALNVSSWSKTSHFYKKHRQWETLRTQYDTELIASRDTILEEIENRSAKQLGTIYNILEELQWFDREVFKAYYLHNHTLDTFSHATGIARQTLYRSINKAKKKIKEKINEVERLG